MKRILNKFFSANYLAIYYEKILYNIIFFIILVDVNVLKQRVLQKHLKVCQNDEEFF